MDRDNILSKIRRQSSKNDIVDDVPYATTLRTRQNGNVPAFIEAVKSSGGEVIVVHNRNDIVDHVRERFADAMYVYSSFHDSGIKTVNERYLHDPVALSSLDLSIIEAELGVAENGAVWLTEKNFAHRLLPFIVPHIALILSENNIVPTMHEAMQAIELDEDGYGVFVSGPSKTADIEQSLVIGAHGPVSLTVILYKM